MNNDILKLALEPIIDEVIALEKSIQNIPHVPSLDEIQISLMENAAFIKAITPQTVEIDPDVIATALKDDAQFVSDIKGAKGESGIDGTTSVILESDIPIWKKGIYREGIVVQHYIGRIYKCLKDTAEEPNSKADTWERLGSSGLRFTGGFDKDYDYEVGDIYVKDYTSFLFDGESAHIIAARQKETSAIDVANAIVEKTTLLDTVVENVKPTIHLAVDKSVDKSVDNYVDARYSWYTDNDGEVSIVDNKTSVAITSAPHPILKDLVKLIQSEANQEAIPITSYVGDLELGKNYNRGEVGQWAGRLVVCHTSGVLSDIKQSFSQMSNVGGGGSSSTGVITGTITNDVIFDYNGGDSKLAIIDDIYQGGKTFEISSNEGVTLDAPYIVIATQNPILTMAGAVVGARLIVSAVDASGAAQLGYENPPTPTFTITAENPNPVVIKVTNAAISPTWIDLGLDITLTQAVDAGKANYIFDMVMSNPTTRTGVVELGMRVNGVVHARTLSISIPANYNQTVSMGVPLTEAYGSADLVELVARVSSNSNNQFSLATVSSVSLPAIARFYTTG